jgi:hypothetical protein
MNAKITVTVLVVTLVLVSTQILTQLHSTIPIGGAAWRQRHFDFFTSVTFRKLLSDNQIA